jgi:poly(A) polymerase
MKLCADWITTPGTRAVFDMLNSAGAPGYFVGGCVRNAVLNCPVHDIDIATALPPDQVMQAAQAQGLHVVPTGLDHGTVTVISQGIAHEITTFRRDTHTDGRHACVAFSASIHEDAARRDFTMNALYATQSGDILDPNGQGLADLAARHVRFIGDAKARIREDYLRILRFFRFFAWYGDHAAGLDETALAACAELAQGIETLSKERIGTEILKTLAAPHPGPALGAMTQNGVLARALAGADPKLCFILLGLEADLPPNPLRRLAALGGQDVKNALGLSNTAAKTVSLLKTHMGGADPAHALGYRLGYDMACDVLALRAALAMTPIRAGDLTLAQTGASAVFPIKAADLMPRYKGPALGQRLDNLRAAWITSQFTLTRDELLAIE